MVVHLIDVLLVDRSVLEPQLLLLSIFDEPELLKHLLLEVVLPVDDEGHTALDSKVLFNGIIHVLLDDAHYRVVVPEGPGELVLTELVGYEGLEAIFHLHDEYPLCQLDLPQNCPQVYAASDSPECEDKLDLDKNHLDELLGELVLDLGL